MNLALSVIDAKDKIPRFRATQIIAHLVNSIEQLDSDQFEAIKAALSRRLRDKEPSIRVQAVLGYGPLTNDGEEEEDDEDDDVTSGIERLLTIMRTDPSPEVRRAVLLNMPIRADTLPFMLERARDEDAGTRRAVYGKLLPELGDFRHLSLVHREKLLRWGLRDRDDAVRKAAARLFRERWIESIAQGQNPTFDKERKPGEVCPPTMGALEELLERIGVASLSGGEKGIAHDCMREFWDGRPDYRDFVKFDDDFWNQLTAETAFLARSYNDYCRNSEDPGIQDYTDRIPEPLKLAYFIRKHLNSMIQKHEQLADLEEKLADLEEQRQKDADLEEKHQRLEEEHEELLREVDEADFIVEQLLNIALTLDYADDCGRKEIYNLMRHALAKPEMPEGCTKLAVELLRVTCVGADADKEFVDVVYEAVIEVRDVLQVEPPPTDRGEREESFHSARSDVSDDSDDMPQRKRHRRTPEAELALKAAEQEQPQWYIHMKCLDIIQYLMQNLHADVGQFPRLEELLHTVVLPGTADKSQDVLKLALKCLALMSLNSKVGWSMFCRSGRLGKSANNVFRTSLS